jgi:hypothetical protein
MSLRIILLSIAIFILMTPSNEKMQPQYDGIMHTLSITTLSITLKVIVCLMTLDVVILRFAYFVILGAVMPSVAMLNVMASPITVDAIVPPALSRNGINKQKLAQLNF